MESLAPKPRRTMSAFPAHGNEPLAMFKDNKPTEYIVEDSRNHDLPELCYGGPMGRLPAELLAQVFEHCLPSDTFSVPVSSQAPLLLAHTCPRWRSVALSTPSLWSTLHIVYKDPSLDVPMASNWLQRSGCLPLSVCISIDFNEQPAQEILDVLCEHASRWKHVRFEFRGLYCPPMYTLSLAENNTPLLRAFEFNARDISSANITPIISLLNSAPELREVTWVDDLADTRRLMELPLSRLTLLSITMSHGTLDYLELLNQCYNLEHIRITRPRPGDTRSPREPLVLSKLTSLNIMYDLTAILDSLVLPALKHVRIHAEGQADRSSGRSISAGGEAAEGTGSGTWSPLTVAGVTVTDKLLSGLTCSPPHPIHPSSSCFTSLSPYSLGLCPSLRDITLNTRISSSPGALLEMAQSRLIPQSDVRHRAERLSLCIWDGHKDLESLESLRGEHCSPSGLCSFELDVLPPPRGVLSSITRFPSRLRTRRHFSGKRRTCQSR